MLQVDDFDDVRDLMIEPLKAVGVELTHLTTYLDPSTGDYSLNFRFSLKGSTYAYTYGVSGRVFHKPLTEEMARRQVFASTYGFVYAYAESHSRELSIREWPEEVRRQFRADQAMVRNMAAMLSDAILYDCRRY